MQYISLDTCVWLDLLKVDLHTESNVFDEICYWIDMQALIHITPRNIIREWDRNKAKKNREIVNQLKTLNKTATQPFKNNSALSSIYQPDKIEEMINKRIERIEAILKSNSEIAEETDAIYAECAKRVISRLAPSHGKESFGDTLNTLSLVHYIRDKGYEGCIFSTLNHIDFSIELNKHNPHPDLIALFPPNLTYVYFDNENFGNKLLNVYLRPILPSFKDYLAEKGRIAENLDTDFIENAKYIDLITSKKNPTAFETKSLKDLLNSHFKYKEYFLRKVGNNGMV